MPPSDQVVVDDEDEEEKPWWSPRDETRSDSSWASLLLLTHTQLGTRKEEKEKRRDKMVANSR